METDMPRTERPCARHMRMCSYPPVRAAAIGKEGRSFDLAAVASLQL